MKIYSMHNTCGLWKNIAHIHTMLKKEFHRKCRIQKKIYKIERLCKKNDTPKI